MNDNMIELDGVCVRLGGREILADLRLQVRRGEFVAIAGASGCGKTTLLNVVSAHIPPSAGRIARRGRTRTIYQQDGLFPWLTVEENVALGMPGRSRSPGVMRDMLASVGLDAFGDHYPHQLSGGMRQRAELARALMGETDILLLDEPFSALDYLTRLRLRDELARTLHEMPRTVLMVTHDVEEASQLADRIVILAGRPARIKSECVIAADRPRSPTHPAVVEAMGRVLVELGAATQPPRRRNSGEPVLNLT